jgi:hypothetical protein
MINPFWYSSPPAPPPGGDPYFASVVLLLHNDSSSFADSSGTPATVTTNLTTFDSSVKNSVQDQHRIELTTTISQSLTMAASALPPKIGR